MKSSMQASASRREFIKNTGKLATVSALANVAIPAVHAAGSDLIRVALIGCGGRGGGAAANALSVKRGPVKLVVARRTADLEYFCLHRFGKDVAHAIVFAGSRAARTPCKP
jgi:hypothetical protein